MPITSVTSDPDALTLTIVGEYPVPVERLWDAWVDPRQIERFFGPPEYPATFSRHDMVVGGRSAYVMSGEAGVTHGYWRVTSIDPGRSFEVVDGFAHADGEPNDDLPTMTMRYTFESTTEGSRFVGVTTFPSVPAMEQLVAMGMVEGATAAFGQMDDVLADLASFAAGRGTESTILDDRRVRISRVIRGSVEQVWRAHHDADLMQQWMLGPDGWTMPICDAPADVGSTFRFGWEAEDGSGGFGFEGEVLESTPPHREVTTDRMSGTGGEPSTNEMTLTAVDGGTLLTLVITYPSVEVRDAVIGEGMVDGLERSYERMEELALV